MQQMQHWTWIPSLKRPQNTHLRPLYNISGKKWCLLTSLVMTGAVVYCARRNTCIWTSHCNEKEPLKEVPAPPRLAHEEKKPGNFELSWAKYLAPTPGTFYPLYCTFGQKVAGQALGLLGPATSAPASWTELKEWELLGKLIVRVRMGLFGTDLWERTQLQAVALRHQLQWAASLCFPCGTRWEMRTTRGPGNPHKWVILVSEKSPWAWKLKRKMMDPTVTGQSCHLHCNENNSSILNERTKLSEAAASNW